MVECSTNTFIHIPSHNIALQSQEILNRPVFVLRNSEKVSTNSQHCLKGLKCLECVNRF
jgi:hypothetical protein